MVRTREEDMTRSEQIRVGDRLTLALSEADRVATCSAVVTEILDSYLLVSFVAGSSNLKPGASFVATYAREDAAYSFESHVIDMANMPADCLAIAVPRRVERQQRRRYFRIRVDYTATVAACDLNSAGAAKTTERQAQSARCLNASGNGLLLGCEASFQPGQHLLLHLNLPGKRESVDAVGRVERIGAPDGRRFSYGVGIFTTDELRREFSDEILMQLPPQYQLFGEKQRTTLINQLFARQAELRQTGML